MNPTVISTNAYLVSAGETQRSMIRRLSIQFDQPVSVDFAQIQVSKTASISTAPPTLGALTPLLISQTATEIVLGFSGPFLEVSGSLTDGVYQLTVPAAAVVNGASEPLAADLVWEFWRLFGDFNADRQVDAADLAIFATAYRSRIGMPNYIKAADFDQDNDVDGSDQTQIYRRSGKSL